MENGEASLRFTAHDEGFYFNRKNKNSPLEKVLVMIGNLETEMKKQIQLYKR
jgi:hypothetical protein